MGIDVRLVNSRGQVVAEVLDPRGYLNWLLSLVELGETQCLRFIDPYGQTVFNRAQIDEFRKELEMLQSRVTGAALQASKEKYLASATEWPDKARAEAATYVATLSTGELSEHLAKLVMLTSDEQLQEPHHYLSLVGD